MVMEVSRRKWLAAAPAAIGAGVTALGPAAAPAQAKDPPAQPFGYCLNTSTIRGQKLSIVEVVEIAARAGYSGLEPWVDEIERYQKGGGSLNDLNKRIRDRGLTVPSSIAFCEWLVD